MATTVSVAELTPDQRETWSTMLSDSIGSSIYAQPDYLDILCRATGGRYQLMGVWRGRELIGGLPAYRESHPAGERVTNRLLLYYHSIVLRQYASKYPSEVTSRHLAALSALQDWLQADSAADVILHNRHEIVDLRPFIVTGWEVRPSYSYLWECHNMTSSWEQIEQNQRRLIKRGDREQLRLVEDKNIEAFWRLHWETHRRKGAPLYLEEQPFRRYIDDIIRARLGHLWLATTADDHVVAGQLTLLGTSPIAHTVVAAADSDYLQSGATPWLRWQSLRRLHDLGYRGTDLTDAALNPVTRFKSQLGGRLVMNSVVRRPQSSAMRRYESRMRWRGRVAGLVRRLRGDRRG